MTEISPPSIRELYASAKSQRIALESYSGTSSEEYQVARRKALVTIQQCHAAVENAALFSSNELVDDIATSDLPYLLVEYVRGDLILKDNSPARKTVLRQAQATYAAFLHRLDDYRLLSKKDERSFEQLRDDCDHFKLDHDSDPGSRRSAKVERYRYEKDLQAKLDHLARNIDESSSTDHEHEHVAREAYLMEIELSIHRTFQILESIAQELQILALRESSQPRNTRENPNDRNMVNDKDNRSRPSAGNKYSERLDPPLADLYRKGKAGPILNAQGRPLQPFTLLDSRQRAKNGVFGPDHALPTMTIDEYLDEERRRGGILDGAEPGVNGNGNTGNEGSNEDDMAKADEETIKAREWDEFVEANPKGSGNTINRG